MIRNLKALSLTLTAIFAIGGLGASTSAATDFFTTTKGSALVTGISHNHELIFTEGSGMLYNCTTTKYAGTFSNGSSELTVEPQYSGTKNVAPHTSHCNTSIGNVEIDTNGCHYVLTGATTGSDNGTDATIWLQCPAGQAIRTTNSVGFTVTIPPQTPTSGGVVYSNVSNHAGGSAVKVTVTATGLTNSCAPVFTCTLYGMAHHADGVDYLNTIILTAYEDSDGLPTPVTEGARLPLEVS